MKVRKLRDLRPEVWNDDADGDQPSLCESAEGDPAGGGVVIKGLSLSLDGVFAIAVGIPCR